MSLLLWLFTLAVAAASDSIMDMVDTRQVERLLAERRLNSSRDSALERNLVDDEEFDEYAEPQLRYAICTSRLMNMRWQVYEWGVML